MSRYVIMDEDGTRVSLRQRQRRVLDPPSRTAHIERQLEPAHIGCEFRGSLHHLRRGLWFLDVEVGDATVVRG